MYEKIRLIYNLSLLNVKVPLYQVSVIQCPCEQVLGQRAAGQSALGLFLLHPYRLNGVMMLKCRGDRLGALKLAVKAGRER